MKREPARSRILVVVGLVLAAAACLSFVWADSLPPRSWWFPVVLGGWLLVVIGLSVPAVITAGKVVFGTQTSRPTRFEVRSAAFSLRPLLSQGFGTMIQLIIYGYFLGMWIGQWRDVADPDPVSAGIALGGLTAYSALIAVWTIIMAILVTMTWLGGQSCELTPEGISSRNILASVFIPWEALHTGGPHRPATGALNSATLRLSFARPELVRYKGLASAIARKNPAIGTGFDVHPWLLADAIRWYAEHPEDRAGIGTQEEHDRLISTVTADYPQQTLRPPQPGVVTWAVWLAVAGAGFSVLLAAANLYIAVAFQDRITAAAMRLPDEESSLPGPWLAAVWLGVVLVGAVLILLAARGVWRAGQGARIGLIALSVLVVLSGCLGSCAGSPNLALLDVPGEEPLGLFYLGIWATHQSVAFLVGISVITLLLLPASDRYFRPRLPA